MTAHETLTKVAGRLSGKHKDDLSTTERQIAALLFDCEYIIVDDQGNILDRLDAAVSYPDYVTTTNGERFTVDHHRDMIQSVHKRFGRNIDATHEAWNRLMESRFDREQVETLLGEKDNAQDNPFRRHRS